MKTKTCTICGKRKSLRSFAHNKWKRSGYGSWCKPCQKEYKDRHYRENKAAYVLKARKQILKVKARLDALKAKPCGDCGKAFPAVCMDFDHVRGVKKFGINRGYRTRAWKEVLQEIRKCELVCANCHRVRTWKRLHAPVV